MQGPDREAEPMLGMLILLSIPLLMLAIVVAGILVFGRMARTRARYFGYASARDYLQAAPRTDAEKRDAADLALKGVVLCVLGVLFPPLVLIGLVPLFYGGRKTLYAWMGLGLVDDPDLPVA
jgi:hypothetical protein